MTDLPLHTYVALLRGINVGGHKQIDMAKLRQAFESCGFQHVKTILNTGNVLFQTEQGDPSPLARTIEETLQQTFGHEIGVILRSNNEIADLVHSDPFQGIPVTAETRLYVTFLSQSPTSRLAIPYETPEKDFRIIRVTDGEVCSVLTLTQDMRTTDSMRILEKEFGKKVTTRNWNTVVKIQAACSAI